MSWLDRLRPAAYTSPSGVRLTFTYEDVSKTVTKNTAGFDFPDADGTYVQDLGHSGRRYPLRVIFHGDNYDFDANDFEGMLLERGVGKLEHPLYGTVNVIPFGPIGRSDRLKTAANQVIFNIEFWETIGLIYPAAKADPAQVVIQSIEAYDVVMPPEFEDKMELDTATQEFRLKNQYQVLLDRTKRGLEKIADVQDNVRTQFNTINDSINNGLTVLVGDPLTLAFQTTQLIQAPARALASIQARISAYSGLVYSLIRGDGAVGRSNNDFRTDDLFASTYVTGLVLAVVNNQFTTQTEALSAADAVLEVFDELVVWRDANLEALGEVDDGGSYRCLQQTVAMMAGFLVEISFTLLQERTVVLTYNRTAVDLTAELYGEVDGKLDFFIASNSLVGSEIIELPRGKEIVYYV